MLFREVINLITIVKTKNSVGSWTEVETPKQVYADKKSIRQNEFYQAQSTGLRPELMFIVRSSEYSGETRLSFDNKKYEIIRTYDKDNEFTELICQGLVGD